LPQARDRDPVLERIDPDDASDRSNEARSKLGKPAGACTDIEHMISRLQRKRTDQEFTVVKLQNARLLVGLSECGCVLSKADDAGKLRHLMDLERCFRSVP
jgi:hypothetical protein